MNIEIVKEVNLAEVIEKIEDTENMAGVALAFVLIAIVIIAVFIYAVVTVSNGQDKDIKKLQERCTILSGRIDNLVAMLNRHD